MIRPYDKRDRQQLVKILRLNTPAYFDAREKKDFEKYLDSHGDTYFVFEKNGEVVGGGGYRINAAKKEGRISWELVSPSFKGKGIGRKLAEHCLSKLKKDPRIITILVSTSQQAHKFYGKFGFKTKKTEKDFWGKGLDLYEMEMK